MPRTALEQAKPPGGQGKTFASGRDTLRQRTGGRSQARRQWTATLEPSQCRRWRPPVQDVDVARERQAKPIWKTKTEDRKTGGGVIIHLDWETGSIPEGDNPRSGAAP